MGEEVGKGTEQKILFFLFCITIIFPTVTSYSSPHGSNGKNLNMKQIIHFILSATIESVITTKPIKQNINRGNTDIRI